MTKLVHQDFRHAAMQMSAKQSLWELTCDYIAGLGFEGVMLADQSAGMMQLRSNIDASWARYAQDEGVIAADPFFAHCFHNYNMMRTGQDHLDRYPFLDEDEVSFIQAASETGLRGGVSIPVRLPGDGGLSGWHILSSRGADLVQALWGDELEELRLSLFAVHHRLVAEAINRPAKQLTTREKDCLCWCAEGARNAEIADRLGISESTVEFHLRNARKKLGARTREHALALSIRQGLLQ